MTLKRRIFISNILMIILPMILSWMVLVTIGVILINIQGIDFHHITKERYIEEWNKTGQGIIIPISMMVLAVIITVAVNKFLTRFIITHIKKPLDTLVLGVKQIGENNLSYRIGCSKEDEFSQVFDTLNETAARLEMMTKEREKNEQARQELIAGISHDLRTPLTSIKVSVEGIKSGVAATVDQQKKYFTIIENKAAEMEHIIEHLFLFSKLEMDDYKVETFLVNCRTMIEDCIEDLSCEYEQRGLVITAGTLPDDCYINIDPLLFRRVIINIVENAVRYKTSDKTGHLSINCIKTENVTITFSDDGPGVAQEHLDKLFDVFYRAEQSRNEKGSGLGLAISAKIISKMSGHVHAELPRAGGLAIVINFPLAGDLFPVTGKESHHE